MKIAVVGCGQVADAHIEQARRLSGVEVAAVCDTNIHMAEQLATRFNIPRYFTNLEEMLERTGPQVVHVTSPPQTHVAVGTSVLQAGAHAYIEKPFGTTLAEADALLDAAERAKRLLCPGLSYLYDPAYLRLKHLYEQGKLGDLVSVEGVMSYDLAGPYGSVMLAEANHWVHRLPGGIPHNNIPHPLSILFDCLQEEKPSIEAEGRRLRPTRYGDARDRFYDELRVMITGKERTGSLFFSCSARPAQSYMVLHGTKARAAANVPGGAVWCSTGTMPPLNTGQEVYGPARSAWLDFKRRLHYFDGMKELFRRFYFAVEGRGPLPISAADIRRISATIDAIVDQCRGVD